MRIGILGGTFDPFHNGHLAIANAAQQQYKLDRVFFIPAFLPPHKSVANFASSHDRLAMVRLGVSSNPDFEVLDMEIKREGISFTVDTLKVLRQNFPQDELFLIIGADNYMKFHTWKDPDKIKTMTDLLIAPRDGVTLDPSKLPKGEHLVRMAEEPVSSTAVRRMLKSNSPRPPVPSAVLSYIQEHQLYQ